jgi:hypothetical protein
MQAGCAAIQTQLSLSPRADTLGDRGMCACIGYTSCLGYNYYLTDCNDSKKTVTQNSIQDVKIEKGSSKDFKKNKKREICANLSKKTLKLKKKKINCKIVSKTRV